MCPFTTLRVWHAIEFAEVQCIVKKFPEIGTAIAAKVLQHLSEHYVFMIVTVHYHLTPISTLKI